MTLIDYKIEASRAHCRALALPASLRFCLVHQKPLKKKVYTHTKKKTIIKNLERTHHIYEMPIGKHFVQIQRFQIVAPNARRNELGRVIEKKI